MSMIYCEHCDKHIDTDYYEIECKEGEQIPSGCGCPNCKGQTRVRWKNNTPPKMKLYAQIGDIKG